VNKHNNLTIQTALVVLFFISLYQYLMLPFLSIFTQCIQAEYMLPHGRDTIDETLHSCNRWPEYVHEGRWPKYQGGWI